MEALVGPLPFPSEIIAHDAAKQGGDAASMLRRRELSRRHFAPRSALFGGFLTSHVQCRDGNFVLPKLLLYVASDVVFVWIAVASGLLCSDQGDTASPGIVHHFWRSTACFKQECSVFLAPVLPSR